jgi:hypothetical protein
MDPDRESRIRKRAYEIWEREGRSGDPEDHWVRAEREIDAEASQTSVEDALPSDSVAAADSAIR